MVKARTHDCSKCSHFFATTLLIHFPRGRYCILGKGQKNRNGRIVPWYNKCVSYDEVEACHEKF